jgi:NAD(P)-dependent dehydrogenase (short-subunit alcohol dehydrogenase family)
VGRLAGKVVIVTGAAQGIGAAVASCVAQAAAFVAVTDIDASGQSVANDIVNRGGRARFFTLDVRNGRDWSGVVEQLLATHGRIDGLVNNAGVNVKYEPLEMPDIEWDRCLDINLRGMWLGCQAVLPTMLAARAGSIVNVSSVHGHQIIPRSFPYPVAKHGVIGLTRALGVEYASKGIRVNAISPGYVDTPLCQAWWDTQPDPAMARRETEALIPARRIAEAVEVGSTAVFLLSDEAPSIVATNIDVDGGRLAMYHA